MYNAHSLIVAHIRCKKYTHEHIINSYSFVLHTELIQHAYLIIS